MHPFFSVSLFTGQQLVLEAIERWLRRPCVDADSQRRRRLGLQGLVSLLLRTAATGVLATLLDAAIEFRRRQLLAAAAAEPGEEQGGAASRFPGLGMLSRAGVAAWKSRLLLCIDELERKAEAYGIESRHRFSKDDGEEQQGQLGGEAGAAAAGKALARQAGSSADLSHLLSPEEQEERSARLGRTVEQLRELVKQGGQADGADPAERRLDDEVGCLVDLLLGTLPPSSPANTAASSAASASSSRSPSVAAALDSLGMGISAAALPEAPQAAAASTAAAGEPSEPASPAGRSSCSDDLCHICMDRRVRVQVAGCQHPLCFGCARRLCASQDHLVPQCPFCRQAIEGFAPIAPQPAALQPPLPAAPGCPDDAIASIAAAVAAIEA